MKAIHESLRTGRVEVIDAPAPLVEPGTVLVRCAFSVISTGTERNLISFGRSSMLGKALQQPAKVKQALEKAKTDGIAATVAAVQNKLDSPMPLGYSCAGTVIAVGSGVHGFRIGDRVAGNGSHAEIARIPQNLCVRVPDGVDLEEAAFGTIAAIAMQGVRLFQPTLGENVVVAGLGLLGLITVQLLHANGCRVLGTDFHSDKLAFGREFGAEVVDLSRGEDPVAAAQAFSRGRGVDGVIVCAGGKSSEVINQAAQMCRVRGRVIQVGLTGLDLVRENFFRKEILFQVSNSSGPGKGDPEYEQEGRDYPVGFVRWTEQRNLEAVMDMLAADRLSLKPLISSRYPINRADAAYDQVAEGTSTMAVVLQYPVAESALEARVVDRTVRGAVTRPAVAAGSTSRAPRVAFIGAGNYATAVLIPAFNAAGATLATVASSGGMSSVHAASKFGFAAATTDASAVFSDPAVDAVAITTRHDTHPALCCEALRHGKHVFVEKPLALKLSQVDEVEAAYAASAEKENTVFCVGFNRRFAPHVAKVKSLLQAAPEPKVFLMTVNAGPLPPDHWLHDPAVGGGRILGEGCHFIDLLRFLAGYEITSHDADSIGHGKGEGRTEDKATITLNFADGSLGTILYIANGHRSFPKERLEVFVAGRVLQLDNYRRLTGYGWPGFRKMNLWRQDKGQKACAAAFVGAVRSGTASSLPIPFAELMEVSRVSIQVAELLR